jgi:hypothetical protein
VSHRGIGFTLLKRGDGRVSNRGFMVRGGVGRRDTACVLPDVLPSLPISSTKMSGEGFWSRRLGVVVGEGGRA